MKIHKYLLGFFLTLLSFTPLYNQTLIVDRVVCFSDGFSQYIGQPGESITVCEGENVQLWISSANTPGNPNECAGMDILNRTKSVCGGCDNLVEPNLSIEYDGGGINYEITNTFNNASPPCPRNERLLLNITPSVNGTLNISWQTVINLVDNSDSPNCSIVNDRIEYNYTGTLLVNVIPIVPTPVLSAEPAIVQPGEQFDLIIENCEVDLIAFIKEQCEDFAPFINQQPISCNNNGEKRIRYTAPEYLTELRYEALFKSFTCPYEIWSDEVVVKVEETPVEDACDNNNTINHIENQIQQAESSTNSPSDFHDFTVKTKVNSSCDIDELWSTYKSSNSFAQPQAYDMPSEITRWMPGIGSLVDNFLPLPATSNCEDYNIYSSTNTIMKLAPRIMALNGQPGVLAGIAAACPVFFSVDILQDPIKIVIDENCKCITRYTLPGHILFPGKTTTCFEIDNCGDIYIVTTGKGVTICGDNIAGETLKAMNEFVGKKIFNRNHNRLNCE